MADKINREKRSWNMSRIKSKDTSIEIKVRKYLFNKGFRFRKNVRELPGTPDIVLKKYNAVIFVHGCFWHRHENCKYATIPKTRTEFWISKLNRNVENDKKVEEALKAKGWRVFILWECELKKKQFDTTMEKLISRLYYKTE